MILCLKFLTSRCKNQVKEFLERLRIVANPVDNFQMNDCYLSETVHIWKNLKVRLSPILSSDLKKKVDNRYKMAIPPCHRVAYSLDPTYMNQNEVSFNFEQ